MTVNGIIDFLDYRPTDGPVMKDFGTMDIMSKTQSYSLIEIMNWLALVICLMMCLSTSSKIMKAMKVMIRSSFHGRIDQDGEAEPLAIAYRKITQYDEKWTVKMLAVAAASILVYEMTFY